MADNVVFQSSTPATPPAGTTPATKEVSFSGNTTQVQLVELVGVTGAEGSRTLNEISNASGLIVQDGGNSLTVDGSVTANAGTNLNTSALALESGGNLAAAVTALQIIDNFISGARGLVTEDNSAGILAAVQTIDNFISGSRGLVTEDNSAAILTAVQVIDNFISGSRGLVTEDNSAAALTALQLIDDYVATAGSAITTKGAAIAGTDGTNARIIKTDASGELQVDVLTMPTVAVTQSGTWDEVGINDSGNSITVDDGAGSLTVDGTVAATQSGTWNVTNVSGTVSLPTGAATLAEQQTQSTALQLIDNLVLAEDAAHVSGDAGVQALAVRKDSGAAIAGADGDYSPLQVDANGNLRVNIAAGAAAGGTSATDEAAYTPTSSAGTPIMGAADETAPDAAAEGTLAIIRSTLNRALHVNLRDASGAEVAVGGGTQYTEDAAATANPVGTALIMVREDARAGSLTSADGDNVAARGTNAGELYVKHVDSIPVTQSGTWDEVGINDSGNSITVDNPALSVTGGGVEASALRVTLASDSTGVLSVDDNGGSLTVDGTVTANLAAGTNNIGDVDILSIAAGDNNIGNVDVVTLPAVTNAGTFATQETGAALTALQLIDNIVTTEDTASANGDSGIVAFARRTATPANTSGTDGDYEAFQMSGGRLWTSAVIDTALPAGTNNIGDVDILTIAAGDNNIGNVDIVTMPNVTLATGTNTNEVVGDVAQDAAVAGNPLLVGGRASTATPTAMSADGDSVYQWLTREGATVTAGNLVDDAAFTPATSRVHPAGYFADETATDSIDEGDIGAARMSLDRKQYVIAHSETSTIYQNGTARTPAFAAIDAATSGDNTLLAAQGASNKIRVHQLFLVSSGTVTVRFESGASGTALTGQMNLVANTGFVLPYSPIGWFETAANTLLNLELSGAVSVDGNFAYTVVT